MSGRKGTLSMYAKFVKVAALVLVGVCVLVGVPLRASAATLWGLDTGNDTLFTLETATGAVNTVGTLPAFSFGGLDWDSSGRLYALLDDRLYLVDYTDASTTLLGSSGQVFESFEILGGVGYSADVFEENLYTVSLLDGSATLVGSHDTDGGDNRITGLASNEVDLFGTRYFDLDLVQVNTGTGGITAVIGSHGVSDITSLAFADGVFWTVPATSGSLYSLSPTDGSATLVQTGLALEHVTGLTGANPIPEPATLVLLGLGAVGLMVRRRRQRLA